MESLVSSPRPRRSDPTRPGRCGGNLPDTNIGSSCPGCRDPPTAVAMLAARPGAQHFQPLSTSPFTNLFVAGAWTDTGWPANLESAILSGRRCVTALLPCKTTCTAPTASPVPSISRLTRSVTGEDSLTRTRHTCPHLRSHSKNLRNRCTVPAVPLAKLGRRQVVFGVGNPKRR